MAHNLYETAMLIATYNVNGINGRLSGLLAQSVSLLSRHFRPVRFRLCRLLLG